MKFLTGLVAFALVCQLTSVNMIFGSQKYAIASGKWTDASTWSTTRGGAAGTGTPGNTDTVWIPSPYLVTLTSSGKTCYNLIIESGGALITDIMNPNSSQRYIRIYGDYVQNDGVIGYDPAKGPDSVTTIGFETYRANGTITFKGSGVSKVSRIRGGTDISNVTLVIDQDLTLTYTGSTGGGGVGYYGCQGTGTNNTLIIKAGRTLKLVDQCTIATSTSGSTESDGPTQTIQADGSILMQGPNSVMSLRPATGATVKLIVNGTVDVGGSFKPSGKTAGDASVITVNSGGLLKVGSSGTGTIYFDAPAQTVTGAGTFQLAGGKMLISSASGLDPVNGPIRTTTRTFSTDASYTFTGTAPALATGSDFPAKTKYLTISDSGSVVTLTNDLAVDTLSLVDAKLATGSKTLTINPNGGILRSTGYVIGNLKKQVATGAVSSTYEVGTANGYSPVTLDFNNVTAGGTVTIAANQSVHPNAVAPNTNLKRYWTITNTGTVFDKYNTTFTYLSADFNTEVSESSDESGLQIAKYSASAWTKPEIGTRAPGVSNDGGTIQAAGLTSFSDFAIIKGAVADTTPVVTIAQAREDLNSDFIPDRKGQILKLSGIVISPDFTASASGNNYYVSDGNAGILLYSTKKLTSALNIGDSICVKGKVDQYRGVTEFVPVDTLVGTEGSITVLKTNAKVPAPIELTIKDLNSEKYEGCLVKIKNVSRTPSSPAWPLADKNANLRVAAPGVQDSLILFIDLDTDIDGKPEPAWPQDITGISSQYTSSSSVYNDGYEIIPRSMADFVASPADTTPCVTMTQAREDLNNDFIPDRKGQVLKLSGVVISPDFTTSASGNNYYVSDGKSGILLYSSKKLTAKLNIGDSILVKGKVDQYRGVTEFVPVDTLVAANGSVTILKSNAKVPAPVEISIKDLNSEKYEGCLVKVKGLIKTPSSPAWPLADKNANLRVTQKGIQDSTILFIDLDTDIDGTAEPSWPQDITGIASQYTTSATVYNDGYEIIPRSSNDFTKTSGVNDMPGSIPASYSLDQNYPNPFNPSTRISFDLKTSASITLKIYSIIGQEVAILADHSAMSAGHQSVMFNAKNLPSGIYIYRLEVKGFDGSDFSSMKKMMLLK